MALNAQKSLLQATSLARSGKVDEALALYDDVLRVFPRNRRARSGKQKLQEKVSNPPKSKFNAIAQLYEDQDWPGVISECHKLVCDYPDSEPLWTFTGAASQMLGRMDVAIPAFHRAVEAKSMATTYANLGAAYEAANLFKRAVPWFEKAQKADPKNPAHLLSLGRAAHHCGQMDTAVRSLGAFIETNRRTPDAFSRFGESLLYVGDSRGAVDAFKSATKLDPSKAAYHNNLGVALRAAGLTDAAVQSTQEALRLNPDHARAHQNLGNLHYDLGDFEAAISEYDAAIRIEPTLRAAQVQKLHLQAKIFDWRAWEEAGREAGTLGITGEPVAPFPMLALDNDPARQRKRSERHLSVAAARWTGALPEGRDKIRLGYFTADVFDHATLHLLNGVFEHHDKDQFEIFAYALNAPCASVAADRFKRNVDVFRDIHTLSDAQAIDLARGDALDIAVDLKGFTHGARSRLFLQGLAPIQINYLGYPGTMGSAAMDYLIADSTVVPQEEQEHYSEKVIFLPHSYQPNDDRREIADDPGTRAEYGLPEEGVVLCCFNNSYKIAPSEFDIWMRVLGQIPGAVLWLMDAGAAARRNLCKEAAKRGIDVDRLVFADHLPQDRHLARHAHADLFIDTFNCNAHTTASDALWAGVPVITLAGRQFASRVAASLLNAMDLPEFVTTDAAEYEAQILELARDDDARLTLKKKLARHRGTTPLFDTAGYTRGLEAGFRAAIDRARAGAPAADIHIKPY